MKGLYFLKEKTFPDERQVSVMVKHTDTGASLP